MSERSNTEATRAQVAVTRARQALVATQRAAVEPEQDENRELTPSERQAAQARGGGRPTRSDYTITERQAARVTRRPID